MKFLFLIASTILLLASCSGSEKILIEGATAFSIQQCVLLSESQYDIRSEESYEATFAQIEALDHCSDFSLPEINFDEHSLIGFQLISNRCMASYEYELFAVPGDLDYQLVIRIIGEEECSEQKAAYHWILTSPIPQNYSVEVLVEE